LSSDLAESGVAAMVAPDVQEQQHGVSLGRRMQLQRGLAAGVQARQRGGQPQSGAWRLAG
jgi:hypothetical protein